MVLADVIEAALECPDCVAAVEWHLVRCRPTECGVVAAWAADATSPRVSAVGAMLSAAPAAHEAHDRCGVRHGPGPGVEVGGLETRSDDVGAYALHPGGFVLDLDSPAAG